MTLMLMTKDNMHVLVSIRGKTPGTKASNKYMIRYNTTDNMYAIRYDKLLIIILAFVVLHILDFFIFIISSMKLSVINTYLSPVHLIASLSFVCNHNSYREDSLFSIVLPLIVTLVFTNSFFNTFKTKTMYTGVRFRGNQMVT